MAQTLEDQVNTIEKSLGERMVEHALVIIRSWLTELGENNPYEQAFLSIDERYRNLCTAWLSMDDENTDSQLDELTGETYQLSDAVYATLRIRRGLSPDMHGFNPGNMESVVHYFSNCVQIRQEDYDWLRRAFQDEDQPAVALMASGCLAKNMRECFSVDGFLTLLDGIKAANSLVADQCLAYVFTLLIQYDIRIDFYPQIQDAFIKAVKEVDVDGDGAFEVLCALVRTTHPAWGDILSKGEPIMDQLPEDVRAVFSQINEEQTGSEIVSWMPLSEREYMQGLVLLLPNTWLYSVLVADDAEREARLAQVYLSVGRMDLSWDNPGFAESYLKRLIRKGAVEPMDYINYGHCLMLRGDRIVAYECYRQARSMCKNVKEFYALFRPDRAQLLAHGVPVEQIYLMEDMLLTGN